MQRYLKRYVNPETGKTCFKRLSVLEDNGLFELYMNAIMDLVLRSLSLKCQFDLIKLVKVQKKP
ncbi:hypothetical protein [Serratia phage SP1]|nr:hypothetical protein [Serratia phage SP1]